MRKQVVLILASMFAVNAFASDSYRGNRQLEPSPHNKQELSYVHLLLKDYHLNKPPFDQNHMPRLAESYLNALDENKHFFLKSDVASIQKAWAKEESIFHFYDLEQPFKVHSLIVSRWRERFAYAISLLNESDITPVQPIQQSVAAWQATKQEQDTTWRQRVSEELWEFTEAGLSIDEAKQKLRQRYQRALLRMDALTSDDITHEFLNALAESVDPGTAYFAPPKVREFNSFNLVGVGLVLQGEGVNVRILSMIENGPASMTKKLMVGDLLVKLTEEGSEPVDVVGLPLDEVVQKLRGPKDSTVTLTLKRATSEGMKLVDVPVVRAQVALNEQAVTHRTLGIPGDEQIKVAHIVVPKLYKDFAAAMRNEKDYISAARDIEKALISANEGKARGVILDLRGNSGGALDEVKSIVDLFIDKGPVVQLRDNRGKIEILEAVEEGTVWSGPTVVITDEQTAAGAELIAGALQDYSRTVTVGRTTYGSGTIQMIRDLNRYKSQPNERNWGVVKLTVNKSYRPSGKGIQRVGVIPDIEVSVAEIAVSSRESDKPFALEGDNLSINESYLPSTESREKIAKLTELYEERLRVRNTDRVTHQPANSVDNTLNEALLIISDMLR